MVPNTATDIHNVEAVQRRSAGWVTRDYIYIYSVTAMMTDLNWRPLDQQRKDSRLVMMYKVTYDLVASPASKFLGCITRESRHIYTLSYMQISIFKFYFRFTFFS